MPTFIAQRGELCLLTLPGFIALTESPAFMPVAQASWPPENENIVGYYEGECLYRLLDAPTWNALLKEHRRRQTNALLDSLRQRGLIGDPEADPPPAA